MSMISAHDLEGKTTASTFPTLSTSAYNNQGFTNPPDGTPCIGWQAHLQENQQWKCVKYQHGPDDQPQFRLQNIRAPGRAMDLYGGSSTDGTEIVGWEYSGFGGHQLWCIRPVGYFPAHGTIVN
ncbi:carbohydrate-binding module family 13 [Fusarium beomiforme]|uniref:Carbohydrate-binding module family 13 n=1 Tax=Fusarium beomiforme TaxID=44412 RepID=A0A9P5E216_9HYPO|nr:carbohydrate-binding module family 13 [Fusarium beomiforme]